mmetsp:Transcript_6082/g.17007  ORF Transcript_6082/g.17007 Transcript_6082/m.17007 type:complete len:233 (-) Transcript_6082:288-986(-)
MQPLRRRLRQRDRVRAVVRRDTGLLGPQCPALQPPLALQGVPHAPRRTGTHQDPPGRHHDAAVQVRRARLGPRQDAQPHQPLPRARLAADVRLQPHVREHRQDHRHPHRDRAHPAHRRAAQEPRVPLPAHPEAVRDAQGRPQELPLLLVRHLQALRAARVHGLLQVPVPAEGARQPPGRGPHLEGGLPHRQARVHPHRPGQGQPHGLLRPPWQVRDERGPAAAAAGAAGLRR